MNDAMSDEKGNLWSWARAISLLSLDLTSAFTEELQIDRFYSERLKGLSRASLPNLSEELIFDEWFRRTAMQAHGFLDKVSEELGLDVMAELVAWMTGTFEGPVPGDLRRAACFLRTLIAEWDAHLGQTGLPLDRPEHTRYRILVRDHVSHCDNLEAEIRHTKTILNSDWDRMMDARYGVPDWSETLLWDMTSPDRVFWEKMAKLLSDQERAELLLWMETRARSECPPYGPWDPPHALTER
jgi:hypothetical protein